MSFLNFSQIDILVIIAYFGLLLANGLWHGRKAKQGDDFLLGGKSFGTLATLATQGATMKGGGALLGYSAGAFSNGLGVLFSSQCYNIGAWVAVIVGIARKLKKCSSVVDIRSSGDILNARFSSMGLKRLGGVAGSWLALSILSGQMAALGLMINYMFGRYGLSYEASLLIGAVFCIIYTMFGGLLSVVYNDLFQWCIMTPMIFFVIPFMFITKGGATPTAIHASLDAAKYFTLKPNIWWLGYLVSGVLAAVCDLNHLTRFISAKDEKTAVRGGLFGFGFTTLWAGVIVFYGLSAAMLLTPDMIPNKDSTLIVLASKTLPSGVMGLFIAAVLATVISTLDSNLQTSVQSSMVDIIEPMMKPGTSEKQILIYCRIWTVIVGALSVFLVLKVKGIVAVMGLGFNVYASAMFFPLMSTMFWKKATKQGMLTGILAGGAMGIIAVKSGLPLPVVWGVAVSTISSVLVSLLTFSKENAKALLPGFDEIGLSLDRKIFWGCLFGLAGTLIFSTGFAMWINWFLIALGALGMAVCVIMVDSAFNQYATEKLARENA